MELRWEMLAAWNPLPTGSMKTKSDGRMKPMGMVTVPIRVRRSTAMAWRHVNLVLFWREEDSQEHQSRLAVLKQRQLRRQAVVPADWPPSTFPHILSLHFPKTS